MEKSSGRVLIVDDNEDILLAAKLLLKPHASYIYTEKNPENIPQLIKSENFDVIFLDMNFTQDMTSGQEGFFWLKEIFKYDAAAIVILITAYGDVETAVRAVKEGATDFVLKPWQNEKFLTTYSAALKLRYSQLETNNLRQRQKLMQDDFNKKFPELIGNSPAMQNIFHTIEKVASTDANVLILGENGTGKELVAHALHKQSRRSGEPFINVDMGAITKTLFESELFGHVKGAFTDAREDRPGRFEIASGGTLFLDEIGNIPPELQSKLLTVLQSRTVARVGANKSKSFDIRLICATNMPIYQMVSEQKFRQDLLYRINTIEITLPPLRERTEDIPLLTDHFLSVYTRKYNKPDLKINEKTINKLIHYSWPGNIRELQHALERSVILCESDELLPSDFFLQGAITNEEKFIVDNYNLEEVEKMVIKKVITDNEGNITKAAKELGLTRTSLYRRMEKYGL
ncbi:MAG: sigma-54-dependent Fis family transcriptional regulator [Ignavibacteriales bacterium]|nr:MAG: sigma-54-dependent Fis family transcriptional regulator [Ignavibacteriales bacterium]